MSDHPSKESESVSRMRREYQGGSLRRSDLDPDPIAQFGQWFAHAREERLHEPNAMGLSTVRADGFPASRTVLLKFFDARGFVFFTNYNSCKAREINQTPKAALLFAWLPLERQVRIEGAVEKVSMRESLKYFASRPRDSQIGAWVSEQSSVVSSRALLMTKLDEIRRKFAGGEVPLPSFWGGFRVIPRSIEFWQGGGARLHDRFRYHRTSTGDAGDEDWTIDRLAP